MDNISAVRLWGLIIETKQLYETISMRQLQRLTKPCHKSWLHEMSRSQLVCRVYLFCRLTAETTNVSAVRCRGRLIETKQLYETTATSHDSQSHDITHGFMRCRGCLSVVARDQHIYDCLSRLARRKYVQWDTGFVLLEESSFVEARADNFLLKPLLAKKVNCCLCC
jgi:hypothetical protein